ncbi:radical SAM protein [Candidatus Omnitrophota bacterium]
MRYIYGPVKSRRLGLSLGIALTPYKTCSFSCIYCQLAQTKDLTLERKEYIPEQDILSELNTWLQNNAELTKQLNYITLCGPGEPTLNLGIGRLIAQIKKAYRTPIAVISNASLFGFAGVRSELLGADLIVPSLDAASEEIFRKINQPVKEIRLEDIAAGLVALRREFKGKIWLEVMLVKGVNDDLRQIKRLKKIIDQINPDKVQINSPVRMAAGSKISSVGKTKLGKIKEILGDKAEIV